MSVAAVRSVGIKQVLILKYKQGDVIRDFVESSVSAVQEAEAELGTL